MKKSSHSGVNVAVLWTVLLASSLTMVFLLWRFPIPTAIMVVAFLTALWISARLATSIDGEVLEQRGHGVQSN
jgi:steroid 5-alpha reductase family enzyme